MRHDAVCEPKEKKGVEHFCDTGELNAERSAAEYAIVDVFVASKLYEACHNLA